MTANNGNSEPSLSAFFHTLISQPSADPEFTKHIRGAQTLLSSGLRHDDHDGPFLSVIMRTQGRRLEAFSDALLCLAAQTDHDFELIVVAHDVDDETHDAISATLNKHIPLLPHTVQLVTATEGTRSRPLNEGVAHARGAYFAFFDDDDLLFAHWVESFHSTAMLKPGRLLHAVSAIQRITPQRWPEGHEGFRTLSWTMPEYALDFDTMRNYVVNHSPFMSIAFPRSLFTTIGFRFDETLDVCEDWDVILRGSSLFGVGAVQHLTSIYRRWEGGPSSYTQHSIDEWTRSEQQIVERFDSEPTLLPAGSVGRIRSLVRDENATIQLTEILSSRSWRLSAPVRTLGTAARAVRNRLRRRKQN